MQSHPMQRQPNPAAPEFGRRVAGQTYAPRPGAYALLRDAQGRVAVLETPRGCYLPGGGIEAGETAEDALRREVREECGFEAGRLSRLGEAVQHLFTPGHSSGIRKECVFFQVFVTSAAVRATEPDHVLRWLTLAEAETKMAHESQVWAVRQAVAAGEATLHGTG